jgi:formylglycine-generating enzyme required for sulfatase activity
MIHEAEGNPMRTTGPKVATGLLIAAVGATSALAQSVEALPQRSGQCNYFTEKGSREPSYSNRPDSWVKDLIVRILDEVGLDPDFRIRAAGVGAAEASIDDAGNRWVLYDPTFFGTLKGGFHKDWAAMSILAHEIGHHVQGHTLKGDTGDRRLRELRADNWSGFILARLGASLKETQSALRCLAADTPSATHPARVDRLSSIAAGWTKGFDRDRVGRNPHGWLGRAEQETDCGGLQVALIGPTMMRPPQPTKIPSRPPPRATTPAPPPPPPTKVVVTPPPPPPPPPSQVAVVPAPEPAAPEPGASGSFADRLRARIAARRKEVEAGLVPFSSGTPSGKGPSEGEAPGDLHVNSLKMALAWCPPGSFQMGSPPKERRRGADEDLHEVQLPRGFYAGVLEVSQLEYQQLSGDHRSHFSADDRPVERVTWSQAVRFCEALTRRERSRGEIGPGWEYRLPSEAEWEYLARAGSDATRYGPITRVAWYHGNANWKTRKVGKLEPNAWGLQDVLGNVSEWTLDLYGAYADAPADGSPRTEGPDPRRVTRGGAWSEEAETCRAADRAPMPPEEPSAHVGFRVVLAPVSQ